MGDALAAEEQCSILSVRSVLATPDTIAKLHRRIRMMITTLLPLEVEPTEITVATSSVITPDVIKAFSKCGGDFTEAVPFCLLRARYTFLKDAYNNPADYDENLCRSMACEVIARRVVHSMPFDRLEAIMSARWRYRDSDGDVSAPVSALETAIDQHATIFLSSTEAQHVVNSLWRGDWIQVNNANNMIDYVPYDKKSSNNFWDHIEPHRLCVPRYQNAFNMTVWVFFLFVYSQCVQTPLDSLDPDKSFDIWEIALYGMAASFFVEEVKKTFKTVKLTPRPLTAINFWTIVNFTTDCLLLSAFGLRVAGVQVKDESKSMDLHLKSFQVLSCVAPLIWMKLLTVFDGLKVIGSLQIVVFRMLRESVIFFILLAVMSIGFAQAMFALDAADGEVVEGSLVVNSLLQAFLGAPDFDTPRERFGYPFGLIIYYAWNMLTSVILLNVLIALFGSAYDDISSNATDEFLAGFAYKTISMIRSPDTWVYIPPFNIIELVIAPTEYILPRKAYDRLNRIVMSVIFCFPLALLALFESQLNMKSNARLRGFFDATPDEDHEDEENRNPDCSGDDEGEISTIKFDDLVKTFPNTTLSTSAIIQSEIKLLRTKIEELEKSHHQMNGGQGRSEKEKKVDKELDEDDKQ